MARKRASTDANHALVTRALGYYGFSVVNAHQLAGEALDAIVGGYNKATGNHEDRWLEIKDPNSKHRLTVAERTFLREWRGAEPIVAASPWRVLRAYGWREDDAERDAIDGLVAAGSELPRGHRYHGIAAEQARVMVAIDKTKEYV